MHKIFLEIFCFLYVKGVLYTPFTYVLVYESLNQYYRFAIAFLFTSRK